MVLADGPEASDSFANKAVEVAFTIGAMAGAKVDRFEAGAGHELVESVEGVVLFENGKGSVGGVIISRLHQYKRHANIGPVGLQKDWDSRVEAGESGVTSDSDFKFVEHGVNRVLSRWCQGWLCGGKA